MSSYPGRSEFELERMVTSLEEAKSYAETRVESLSYEVQQLRAELNNANARAANAEALLDECRRTRDENQTEVDAQEGVLHDYEGEIAALTQQNEELEAALAATKMDLKTAEGALHRIADDEERFAEF